MKKLLLTLCMLTALPGVVAVHAQRFDAVERRNPWNGGVNRAGLRSDTLSLSYAEAWASKQNGALTSHSQSDDSFAAGVKTESIRHLKRVSFAGRFDYSYFDGRNMCGSMFMQPGFYPMDIYEFTPGRKIRENYAFTGALSADLAAEWRGGLWVDFAAGNYAKRKDLRHKNTRLDFAVAPGVQWHRGDWAVGAAYLFVKNSERVEASEIGSTPLSYEAFFDKGLYYGEQSLWTGNGIHLTEAGINAFPVRETMHGASVQLQWRMLFAEAEYRREKGDTGEKGTTWHEFDGDRFAARVTASLAGGKSMHYLRWSLVWRGRENREQILQHETVGGVTNTVGYGSVPVYAERSVRTGIEYEWACGASNLRAGAEYLLQRQQSSLLYPLLREQRLHTWRAKAEGLWSLGRMELSAGIFCSWGDWSAEERAEAGPEPDSAYPLRLDEYAEWDNEYRTATRAGASLGVRVRIVKGFYADLSARYEHGFGLHRVPQPNRVEAILSLGYRW